MKVRIPALINAVLNSYAALFFSQNRALAVLVLLATFLNPVAGLSGLTCTLIAIGIGRFGGFNREVLNGGLYSFNNLLAGIYFGTFYSLNGAYLTWLVVTCLCCSVITVVLSALLGKYNLPVLSIPFTVTLWVILTAQQGYPFGIEQRMSPLLNETSVMNAMPQGPALFFRALSSIIFQDSVVAGIAIAVGLLIHSRIAFCLLVIGFFASLGFNRLTGVFPEGISHYHLGANLMMTVCAIGGFFLIPSWRSYAWAVISVPIVVLVITGLTKAVEIWHLPVFSLPFSVTTIGMLYFFMLRTMPGKLQLTRIQHYSPERNLYRFMSSKERLFSLNYFRLNLPFMGNWTVSQGYDGDITHKGDWSKALDFVVADADGKTYRKPGNQPEQYYCFNKPVLACADGVVEDVVNHIDDNAIGDVNVRQNWGNSIVIKHTTGLYSKVSHLKKGSARVKPGDYVREGDVIGMCGNSGRSPEPHLHFQVQATPYIGSRTTAYPFAYFTKTGARRRQELVSFGTPVLGDTVGVLPVSRPMKQALTLPPGYTACVSDDRGRSESWEVFTDAFNHSYIYCGDTRSSAWFVQNGTVFYFTHFSGDRDSLLYLFYLAAFKVICSTDSGIAATDHLPLDDGSPKPAQWLNDLLAPFGSFISKDYRSYSADENGGVVVRAEADEVAGRRRKPLLRAEIRIGEAAPESFTIEYKGTKIKATWEAGH